MAYYLSHLLGKCPQLDCYIHTHKQALSSPVLRQFLADPHHCSLFTAAVCQTEETSGEALNQAFIQFREEKKLTAYILKSLHWHAVQFDKKQRKREAVHPLIVDSDTWEEPVWEPPQHSRFLAEELESRTLYAAYQSLTPHQQWILQKSYAEQMRDIDLSFLTNVTPQAVYRSRRQGLSKLYAYITASIH
ncbi:hypothetical protein ATL39_0231 [Sinobaca qinghaiensis]|uniref:RNA polymerase sigma factor (Sigma-70 family) n=1 Tax=Sinobaca qinghaiensis TaxID=342944 RepID=A0A419V7X2_9BACL|nr:sigma-70 family RNA polymerase sigma factor [Sinobaca qinghaiensis]RKD76019.1 hypothetical protein ATL39_0231 [Sinobaca qinghaiensis]